MKKVIMYIQLLRAEFDCFLRKLCLSSSTMHRGQGEHINYWNILWQHALFMFHFILILLDGVECQWVS